METLLQNGDHLLDHRGVPLQVDGTDALLQRALLRLSVRRGTLAHDPSFGSELHRLGVTGERAALNTRVLACAREALAPLAQVGVAAADCAYDPSARRLKIRLRLRMDGRDYTLEVQR